MTTYFRRFEVWQRLGGVEIEDQIAITKYLINNLHIIDPRRVNFFYYYTYGTLKIFFGIKVIFFHSKFFSFLTSMLGCCLGLVLRRIRNSCYVGRRKAKYFSMWNRCCTCYKLEILWCLQYSFLMNILWWMHSIKHLTTKAEVDCPIHLFY